MSNRDVDVVDAQEDKSAGSKDDDVDARFAGYVESNNNNNNLDFEHELEFNNVNINWLHLGSDYTSGGHMRVG